MDIEQRTYIRFSVQDNAFAALRPGFIKLGRVNDISNKGLAFSYLMDSPNASSDRDYSKVDIFLSDNGLHLHKMPCKIVYDIQRPKYKKDNSIKFYRCGLQFGKLSKSQSELLELFLENYTTEPLLS